MTSDPSSDARATPTTRVVVMIVDKGSGAEGLGADGGKQSGAAFSTRVVIEEGSGQARVDPGQDDETPNASFPRQIKTTPPTSKRWALRAICVSLPILLAVATIDWIIDLAARTPLLGAIAALATGIMLAGGLTWIVYEIAALLKLRTVEQTRMDWSNADARQLHRLIRQIGHDLGELASAERIVEKMEGKQLPEAKQIAAAALLRRRDAAAVQAISNASRRTFIIVSASPTALLDVVLSIGQTARLLREIAVAYGHRPGALALRALALAAVRNASIVAVADVLSEAVAGAAGKAVGHVGESIAAGGKALVFAPDITGVSSMLGAAMAVGGTGLSVIGRGVDSVGGTLGGGVAATWRMSRFGLIALIAARPLPLNDRERADLASEIRTAIMRWRQPVPVPPA